MVKRGSAIGFFGLFGRSEDMRRLDEAMRRYGLHPAQVPEAVKLATVGLMAESAKGEPPPDAYPAVGSFMAYCLMGEGEYAAVNGEGATDAMAGRLERALEEGEGPDAELVLLFLHAKLVSPVLIDRYDLRAEDQSS